MYFANFGRSTMSKYTIGLFFAVLFVHGVGAKTILRKSDSKNSGTEVNKSVYVNFPNNSARRPYLPPVLKSPPLPLTFLLQKHIPWPGQTINTYKPGKPLGFRRDEASVYRSNQPTLSYNASAIAGLMNKKQVMSRTAKKDIPLYHDSRTFDCDYPLKKHGSFKISDGPVQGFGTYELDGDEISIDLNIRISNEQCKPHPTGARSRGEEEGPSLPTVETTPTLATSSPTKDYTSPATQSAVVTDVSSFEKEALEAHNGYRSRHDAPAMNLNPQMSKSASEWAKYLAENHLFEHSSAEDRDNQGENIAVWCDSTGESATKVTDRWYDEVCNSGYDFSRNKLNWSAGHFTQIVWIATTEFGIGYYDKVDESNGRVCRSIVARYNPAGNAGDSYLENVKQGSFDKKMHCNR